MEGRLLVNQHINLWLIMYSSNIGKVHFGAIQGATSFASSFPHIFGTDEKFTNTIPALIPCAIDQDPYFRVTRDVASRLHFAKPALLHTRFLDALQGPGSKMSASDDSSAIFMNDEPSRIKNKIVKHAFSGGQETEAQQRELGGDPDKDVAFQYLTFFLEDDEELERIRVAYRKGEMLTGELKQKCIAELQVYVKGFQERREALTDADVADFFAHKKLVWKGSEKLEAREKKQEAGKEGGEAGEEGKELTQNQKKKLAKEKLHAEQKAKKLAEKAEKAAAAAVEKEKAAAGVL